jgi:aryl-alcohol dehydrogenase-like predicted oxidoreductase
MNVLQNKARIMKKFSRREMIQASLACMSALSAGLPIPGISNTKNAEIDQVELGKTGLKVSRLALGCGNKSWARQSKFTRLGVDTFLKVAPYAFERGVTFLDTADLYGTHPFIGELFKSIPRDNFQLLTKIWTTDADWYKVVRVQETLDRFKKEMGTDYFDIVLLHAMESGNWIQEKQQFRDQLGEAKAKGEVKKVGVSCHNIDALRVAAKDPWVDIILARINPYQMVMDGTPEEIMTILEKANKNGKGVIGMKIFGNGDMSSEEQRNNSLNFSIRNENIHAVTIGLEKFEYVDYAVDRITDIAKS